MKRILFFLLLLIYKNICWAQWHKLDGPNTGVVSTIGYNGSTLFAACKWPDGSASYYSNDFGNTWSNINLGLDPLDDIASFTTIGTTVFAATSQGKIFKSIDNGITWQLISTIPSSITNIKFIGNSLFVLGGYAIYKSIDFGQSWSIINYPVGLSQKNDLELDASGNFFLASANGLYFSNDNGINWSQLTNGLTPTFIYSVAISGSRIFAGGGGGIFKSDDGGLTWLPTSVTSGWWPDILVDAGIIYAGCYGGVIEKSTNNGLSWTYLANGTKGVKFNCLVKAGNNIIAGTSGGVYISTNAGVSWQEKNTGITCAKIDHLVSNGTTLFASVINMVYSSIDEGLTWNNISNSLPVTYDGDNVIICDIETNGNNVFVGTDGQGLFKSSNQGVSWQPINGGVLGALNIYTLYINDNEIFAGTENGVYFSSNGGASWSPRNTGITNNYSYLGGLASDGTNIIIGTQGGIFFSNNKGVSWNDISVGLPITRYTGTAVIDGEFFVSGALSNNYIDTFVYYSKDFGNSWQPSTSSLLQGGLFPEIKCLKPYRGQIFSTESIIQKTNVGWHVSNIDPTDQVSDYSSVTDVCANSNYVFLPTRGSGLWRRTLLDFGIYFPKLSLNNYQFTQGQSIILTGSEFKNNASTIITIQGPAGFIDVINTASDGSGLFTYNYTTTYTMPIGNYSILAKDMTSGFTTVVKSFTLNGTSPVNYLSITNPAANYSFDVNENVLLEFKDKMICEATYPIGGSNRFYSYFIELSTDGGLNWQPVSTLTGQALINEWIIKQHFISIATPGSNYKFRITDTYRPSNFVISPVFVVNNVTVTGNLKVQLQWDYSYPQIGGPVNGICADGTARIYLDLSKINGSLGVAINSVSVNLNDGGVNTGYAKLGKVKVATNTSSYSSEANGTTTITAINNIAGLSDYYFWYIAPDDFAGNDVADESGSERFVNAIFTVTFADASIEVISKKIKIVRPPLMLVHGLGGDPSTWDYFRENLFGTTLNFTNNNKFKTVVPVSIDPASNFANNAFNITGDGTINSMPGIVRKMRLNGYASVKVDYIGHSMGGSVLRYALDHFYNRYTRTGSSSHLQYKNYEAGYVNKIITLGTPHNGSPIADIINRYVGDIPFFARFTLQNWYGATEKAFPFYYINPIDPNAFFWNYEPTGAVMDLRTNGGVPFYNSNIKAHLIAGDIFPGAQINLPSGVIPQGIIDQVHDAGDNTLEHFINYLFQAAKINEADPVLKQAVEDVLTNIGPINDALSFLEKLSLAMDALNYTTFVPESDLIVSVNSQCAGYSRTNSNVTVVDNYVGHMWPLPNRETNNLQIGNTVMQLLNEPINSSKFDVFPDNNFIQRKTQQQLQPLTTNSYFSTIDTTILKFVQPMDSSDFYVDSIMMVTVNLLDTAGLKTLNIYFQGKTYPIYNFTLGYISIYLQVNSNELNLRKLVVEGYYNYTDSAKLVYDERTINVSTNDTLIGFEVTPDLIQLAINQISFAEYIAKYVHFSTPLGNFDQSLMILINDSNIVSFDTSIHGFKGRNNGQTFAVASYQGFSDTIYFDVTGCVGGTVNITSSSTSICQGDTLQLTASSGIQFEWSTGDTTQSILVTTGGEYSLISIDDNNCIASKSIDIIVTALPSITSSITNVNCYGNNTGTVTATVTSGTSPYLYSWSPSGGNSATASNLSAGNYILTVTDSFGCVETSAVNITQPLLVTATTTAISNVNCHGDSSGSATVIPGGGTGGFTYLWIPSGGTGAIAQNLSAGTYSVIVSDSNECTATSTASISQPAAFVIATSITNATCVQSDGSALVNVSGGTGQYSYFWNSIPPQTTQTAAGLAAGVYNCTISDSIGCTTTSTIIIGNTTTLTATSSQTNILCYGENNGTATILYSGGIGPFTFLWTPSGQTTSTCTSLASGIHVGTVTDSSGCIASLTVFITEPTLLSANVSTIDSVNCNGGSDGVATIIPLGGTPAYSYLWSNGETAQTATNLFGTTYTCTVVDTNGCIAVANIDIGEPSQLIVSTTIVNATCETCCDGQVSVSATGGTSNYHYLWSNGEVTPIIDTLCPDTFTVVVTDANFCSDSISVIISSPVGIEETQSINVFTIFPNPTSGIFTVETNSRDNETILLRIFNSLGKMIYDKEVYATKNFKYEVDLTGNATGIYLFQMTDNKSTEIQRLIMK